MSIEDKVSVSQMLSKDIEGARESLNVMLAQECTTYLCTDYLAAGELYRASEQSCVTEFDRTRIVDWCFSVIDHCNFSRETVAVAMELLDRFMSQRSPKAQEFVYDRRQYQLAAMAALYIAIKLHERVAFGADFFAAMSRGAYCAPEIEAMEMVLLRGLGWRMAAPTPLQVAHLFLSLLAPRLRLSDSAMGALLDEVRYQTEHATRDFYFVQKRSSTLAIAAILNSLQNSPTSHPDALVAEATRLMNDFHLGSPYAIFQARNRFLCILNRDTLGEDALTPERDPCYDCAEHSPKKRSDDSHHQTTANKSPRSVLTSQRQVLSCDGHIR